MNVKEVRDLSNEELRIYTVMTERANAKAE